MGRLIICSGKRAQVPYEFLSTHRKVSTIEELCYYMSHNMTSLKEDLYQEKLVDFLSEGLGLLKRAELFKQLLEKKAPVEDLIVTLFVSCDLYSREEINAYLKKVKEFYSLLPIQQEKWIADQKMKQGNYQEAMKHYLRICSAKEVVKLSSMDYGNVLHNMGVIYAKQGDFIRAAEAFLGAYERNAKVASLKQYLFVLKLSGNEKLFEREKKLYVSSRELLAQVNEELLACEANYENSSAASSIHYLNEMRSKGSMPDYYRKVADMISEFKEDYRNLEL